MRIVKIDKNPLFVLHSTSTERFSILSKLGNMRLSKKVSLQNFTSTGIILQFNNNKCMVVKMSEVKLELCPIQILTFLHLFSCEDCR